MEGNNEMLLGVAEEIEISLLAEVTMRARAVMMLELGTLCVKCGRPSSKDMQAYTHLSLGAHKVINERQVGSDKKS